MLTTTGGACCDLLAHDHYQSEGRWRMQKDGGACWWLILQKTVAAKTLLFSQIQKMGIKGLNKLLGKFDILKSNGMPLHNWSPGSEIYVDLLACFYWRIVKAMRSENHYDRFLDWLTNLFSKDRHRVTIVIDGSRSAQKHLAHELRDARVSKALDIISVNLQKENRLKFADHRRIRKNIARSFSLTYDQRVDFYKALVKRGFKAILCKGEADIFIAQRGYENVLTRDSDFFCHGSIPTVLNFWIWRDQLFIRVIEKTLILERLKIDETVWRVLGIVSGNDYSGNVHGYGANRNLKILRYIVD